MQRDQTAICVECGCETEYIQKSISRELTIHGVPFQYIEYSAYCTRCGNEVYVVDINDKNAQSREYSYKRVSNDGS